MIIGMYIVGFGIFCTYMFFLLRMINRQHKEQEKQLGKVEKPKERIIVKRKISKKSLIK